MTAHDVDPQEVARLYQQEGMSTRRIAARVGVSHTAVHRLLKREQVERRPVGGVAGLQVSEGRRQELMEAYQAGMPLHDMRAAFRASDKTIKKVAQDAGLPARERGGPRVHDWDQIEQLHLQGWPAPAIAELLHAGEGHVRHILREQGYGRDVVELPDAETLKGLYAELGSVAKAAARLGAARDRVRDALVAAGVEIRARAPKPAPGRPLPDGETLLRLYGELRSVAAVAAELRIDRERIRDGLVAVGWTPGRPPVPTRVGRPLPDADTLKGLYAELGSVAKVAQRLRVSRDRVGDALADAQA
ncbi:helix-turn-helix domain-containing protein [Nonomuraea sp. NPDC005650]|uniref:helix-turn-helix domain-containing protein n=1 Tax=Nonomuraea sp. NPDC005650 TaxID=3157045 RepID=UPI0033AD8895